MSARLQHLVLHLWCYQVHLTYVPGKNLVAADALTRAPLQQGTKQTTCDVPVSLFLLVSASVNTLALISGAMAKGGVLQQVVKHCQEG